LARRRQRLRASVPARIWEYAASSLRLVVGQGMSRQDEGAWLLVRAADSVSATLKEIPEIEWPVCAVHGGHPDSIWDGEESVDLINKVPWWQCANTGMHLPRSASSPPRSPRRCDHSPGKPSTCADDTGCGCYACPLRARSNSQTRAGAVTHGQLLPDLARVSARQANAGRSLPRDGSSSWVCPAIRWTEWKDLARSWSVDIRFFAHGVVDVRRALYSAQAITLQNI
jgi:hypothetical protein